MSIKPFLESFGTAGGAIAGGTMTDAMPGWGLIVHNVFQNNSGDGINFMGSSAPAPVSRACAYCGMDDFAHNQCQRCGAPRSIR